MMGKGKVVDGFYDGEWCTHTHSHARAHVHKQTFMHTHV